MDTMQAYNKAQAARARGDRGRVFDWDKAAEIIKRRGLGHVCAGLSGDLECTGGTIHDNDGPVFDDYTYLASVWAEPVLVVDGEQIPCWVYDDTTTWGSGTKWPESALKILHAAE